MEEILFKQIAEYGIILTLPLTVCWLLYKELKVASAKNDALQDKLMDTLRSQISSTDEIKAVLGQVVETNKELIALKVHMARYKGDDDDT